MSIILLLETLIPETALEKSFFEDDDFILGLMWGKPRKGHPEGEVYKHIIHVFDNIEKLNLSSEDRQKLRIVALVHDSFKFKEVIDTPRDWSKHHGVYAAQFLSAFTNNETLLGITKWHDEAYYCWRDINNNKDAQLCAEKVSKMFLKIQDYIQLYYLFFVCDTMTGDKNLEPIQWFEETFADYIDTLEI